MGVDARAVAMYGVYFKDKEAANEFLEEYGIEEVDEMESGVELCCLNLYSGDPFILGYDIKLGETLDKYKALWEKDFPNSKLTPSAHLEVIWY